MKNLSHIDKEDIILTLIFLVGTLFMISITVTRARSFDDWIIAGIGLFGMGFCLARQIVRTLHNRDINIREESEHVSQE